MKMFLINVEVKVEVKRVIDNHIPNNNAQSLVPEMTKHLPLVPENSTLLPWLERSHDHMHSQCTVNLTNVQSSAQSSAQSRYCHLTTCTVRNRFRNIVCLVPDDWSHAWMCCSHDLSSPECTSNPLHNLIDSVDMQVDFHDIQQRSDTESTHLTNI